MEKIQINCNKMKKSFQLVNYKILQIQYSIKFLGNSTFIFNRIDNYKKLHKEHTISIFSQNEK